MMKIVRILLVLGCVAYVLLGVRRRDPGLGLTFLGLGLITGGPLVGDEQTATTVGWVGAGLILLAGVFWIGQRVLMRRRRTG